MNASNNKLVIALLSLIVIMLAVLGYLFWNMNKEPMPEVSVSEPAPAPVPDNTDPKVMDLKPVEENKKSKVKIYTEQVKVDESGDNWDIKVLQTINDSNPEILTTLRDVNNFGEGLSYNIELSPDKNNLVLDYTTSSSLSKLQLFNIETKETRDILLSKSGFNIGYPIFSPNSKEVFFLRSKSNNRDKTYDFYLYNIESQKNEIIKTVTTRSGIFNPLWLPENQILLTYSLETSIEKPESRYEVYSLNLIDKKISNFPNKIFNQPNYSSNIFNQDNTLFTKAKTFTTKEFEGCYADISTHPNSFGIIETLSGKEIASFKGNSEEPILPLKFSPDNKEILYTFINEGCKSNYLESRKYYVQSLYDDKLREEVKLDDIVKEWDLIFNSYPPFSNREIIFYQ